MSGVYWQQQLGIYRCGTGLRCPFCYARRDWNRRIGRAVCGEEFNKDDPDFSFDCDPGDEIVGAQFDRVLKVRKPQIILNGYTDPSAWSPAKWQQFEALARTRPDHQFLLLTKKPTLYGQPNFGVWSLPNVWRGQTVTQGEPYPVAGPRTWLSCEPLTGPVSIPLNAAFVVVGAQTPGRPTIGQVRCISAVVAQCDRYGIPCWVKHAGDPDGLELIRNMPEQLRRIL